MTDSLHNPRVPTDSSEPRSSATASGSRRYVLAGLVVAVAVGVGAWAALTLGNDGQSSDGAPGGDDAALAEPDETDPTNDDAIDPGASSSTSENSGSQADEATAGGADVEAATTETRYVFANNTLLGSWDGASWIQDSPAASEIDGLTAMGAFGEDTIMVELADTCFSPDGSPAWFSPGSGLRGLAVTGTGGNLLTISGTSISPAQAHIDVVATQLQAAGLNDVPVEITEVLRVDLENDGVDEVLITASRGDFPAFGSRIGDYSVAILRRVLANDEVENIVLAFSATTGNEPGLQSAEELYGETDGAEVYLKSVWTFTVESLVDLNGDGVAEIGLQRVAFESWGMDVFDTSFADVSNPVLTSTCGS